MLILLRTGFMTVSIGGIADFFRSTPPRLGGGYFSSPPIRAGNLFVPPLWGRSEVIIPHPPVGIKRETRFLEVSDASM